MKKRKNIFIIIASLLVFTLAAFIQMQMPVNKDIIASQLKQAQTTKETEVHLLQNTNKNNIDDESTEINLNKSVSSVQTTSATNISSENTASFAAEATTNNINDGTTNNTNIETNTTSATVSNTLTKYNKIKSIKLDKTKIRLNKGDKRTLTAKIKYKTKKYPSKESVVWKSSNKKIATVSKKGIVKGKSKGTAYITVTSKSGSKSAKCKVIVGKTKYIAFTFDDGPGIYTDGLLDTLEKYHCQATFFVLGNRVGNNSSTLKRAYNMGMEIGSHTYSHQNLNALSKNRIIEEINKANKSIKKVTGSKPTLMRPPYGNYNKTVSKNVGVPMIYWSVDTLDWKYRNANYVKNTILKNAGDGEIILLHDIHQTSVAGFKKALPKLRKKGYELVTVSELYKIKGKKLKKGIMYFGPNN